MNLHPPAPGEGAQPDCATISNVTINSNASNYLRQFFISPLATLSYIT